MSLNRSFRFMTQPAQGGQYLLCLVCYRSLINADKPEWWSHANIKSCKNFHFCLAGYDSHKVNAILLWYPLILKLKTTFQSHLNHCKITKLESQSKYLNTYIHATKKIFKYTPPPFLCVLLKSDHQYNSCTWSGIYSQIFHFICKGVEKQQI